MATFMFLFFVCAALARLFVVFVLSLFSARRVEDVSLSDVDLAEVTIIVPALDEAPGLAVRMDALLNCAGYGASVVFVDDGSRDETLTIARNKLEGCTGACVISFPDNRGKTAALNAGLEAATTPYVLTLDADTHVDVDSLWRAVLALDHPTAIATHQDIVAFDVSVPFSRSLFSEIQGVEYDGALNFERCGQGMVRGISVAPGAASLWRRAPLVDTGGFFADTVTEDVDATLRLAALGHATIHVAGAVAWTDAPDNMRHLLVQRRRWCLGHWQNIPLHMPRAGDARAYCWITYPNFVFLSVFMPAMAAASALLLVTELDMERTVFVWLLAVWLPLVYVQRACGLWFARRRSSPIAFLIEPFTTALLHMVAFLLVAVVALRRLAGRRVDVWDIRT
ncbi:glycosyltransferase [Ruegeria atlantica]|uniref:glycosyltransferase n=1 Tax=Ruegeria atlantica TaxID=81569 RepID=UPI0014817CAD|nr:glycosyltransferase family 2 protein [Ruegeria atlantica]